LEAEIEKLTHDKATGGGLRRNLEQETQLLVTEAGHLRRERDSRLSEKADMLLRLRLLTPALSEARRRVRELEDKLENATMEASRERQLVERLEREAGVSQDKMRVLRDQNVKLAGQCTELETQLATGPARRTEASAVRSRSASVGGSRSRGTSASERLRRASRGPVASVRSTVPIANRARPSTPLAGRPGRGGTESGHPGFGGVFEDLEANDVVVTDSIQPWLAAGSAIRHPARAASAEHLEHFTPLEFDIDSGLAGRSTPTGRDAGISLVDSTHHGQNWQYLKDWIQSEEERLAPTKRSSPCA
jgi:hypothetical protein